MVKPEKLARLREVITENLRVQRDGEPIDYANVGTAVQDATSKQNHAIFARRRCGRTLLLHYSARSLKNDMRAVYLNCEDFKRHSFPNVLIEILRSLFQELDHNMKAWFGKKKKSKEVLKGIIARLETLQRAADVRDEEIKRQRSSEAESGIEAAAGADIDRIQLKFGAKDRTKETEEVERSFRVHREKLQELDRWLPELKDSVRDFFKLSNNITALVLQVDDLYHLKRTDQAFIVDYIHRLCKDVPLYFKIATQGLCLCVR
jgi:hypothetical protein